MANRKSQIANGHGQIANYKSNKRFAISDRRRAKVAVLMGGIGEERDISLVGCATCLHTRKLALVGSLVGCATCLHTRKLALVGRVCCAHRWS